MTKPFLVLATALVLSSPAVSTPQVAAPAQPAVDPRSPAYWRASLDEGIAEAKRTNKRILLALMEEPCGQCDRMEELVLPAKSFDNFAKDKVPVRVRISSDEGRRLAERFRVPGPPAWFVLTPDLLVCGFQGGANSQDGWFRTFVETERSWAAYLQKLKDEQKDPANLDLVYDVAVETFGRRGEALAEARFQRLVADKRSTPQVRESSMAYLATIALESRRVDEAAGHLETLKKTTKDKALLEKVELGLVDVDIARGRNDLALKRLKDFKAAHPYSTNLEQVDELIKALSGGAR